MRPVWRIGRTTLVLGAAGLAAATAVLLGVTDMAAVGVFALVGFHLILGPRTFKLAGVPHSRTLAGV